MEFIRGCIKGFLKHMELEVTHPYSDNRHCLQFKDREIYVYDNLNVKIFTIDITYETNNNADISFIIDFTDVHGSLKERVRCTGNVEVGTDSVMCVLERLLSPVRPATQISPLESTIYQWLQGEPLESVEFKLGLETLIKFEPHAILLESLCPVPWQITTGVIAHDRKLVPVAQFHYEDLEGFESIKNLALPAELDRAAYWIYNSIKAFVIEEVINVE